MRRLAACVALWQATLVCVAAPDAPLDGTDFSSSPAEGGAPAAPGAEREESDARRPPPPPAAAIVLIGGNARTFLCTFQLLLERLVLPLDPERRPHPGADVFAFLKTVDPGPKNQTGNDRTYPDVSKAALRAALATYPHVVGSTIVMEPACQGACLLAHHVRCRERFTGFLGDPGHLARATAFATGLEFLGKELEALEDVRGRRYAVVAWMRPDAGQEKGDSTSLQRECSARARFGNSTHASRTLREMIARPKISRNERKTTEIGAFEVGNFAPFSCPGPTSSPRRRAGRPGRPSLPATTRPSSGAAAATSTWGGS
jgi:hypothetical protein